MIDGITPGSKRPSPQKIKTVSEPTSDEPKFRPPEDVAQLDASSEVSSDSETQKPAFAQTPTKHHRRSPVEWFQDLGKSQKIILLVSVLLVLGGGGVAAYVQISKKPAPVVSAPVAEAPKTEPPKETIIIKP